MLISVIIFCICLRYKYGPYLKKHYTIFCLKIYILFPGRNVQRIDDRVFESNTLSGKTYMAHFFRRVADDKFWYFQEPKSTLVTPCLVAIKGRDDSFQLHLPPYLTPQYQWRTVFTCVSVLTPVFDTYDLLLLQKGLFLTSPSSGEIVVRLSDDPL